jgi:D-alanyl-lipoteichoic acid acyltransferase DltB (MBOAT superfamily)
VYWSLAVKRLQVQNFWLLCASYFFYGWWDWRFLFLLVGMNIANFFTGILIERNEDTPARKLYFISGLVLNIGMLCIFKYFNFFVNSFSDLIALTGYKLPESSIKVVLPLGISFYTFISLSYLIDIYRKSINAGHNLIEVLLSLSFFPVILAGPIQRPAALLPQIRAPREFNYKRIVDGLRQILWGLFVKIAVADNFARDTDAIFADFASLSGSTLLFGVVFYTIQIYADFSGYSNIAIGSARLLGFDLMRNFAYPYFSRDIAEFWKRWHMSLTAWFRDYLFLPLSTTLSFRIHREKMAFMKLDTFIYLVASTSTWFLTGLWHGASYSFIAWGLLNGLFLIVHHLQLKPRKKLLKRLSINNNSLAVVIPETLITLCLVMAAWVFFRTGTLGNAIGYFKGLISASLFTAPQSLPVKTMFIAAVFMIAEWIQREKEHALQIDEIKLSPVRWALYLTCIYFTLFLGGSYQKFIYFQF